MVDEPELGELYREMGRTIKARAKLAKATEDAKKLCEIQITLIQIGYKNPARF